MPYKDLYFMRQKTQKKRKSVLLRIALLVFFVYCIYMIASYQVELIKTKQETAKYKEEISERQLKLDELQHLLDQDDNSEIIERAARDKLGYVYSYERSWVDIGNK